MSPKAVTEEAPVEQAAAVAEAPPEPIARNFTATIEVYGFSDSDSEMVTTESYEAALKEQVTLPVAVDIGGIKLSISGAKVSGSSEGDAGKPESGFGRDIPVEETTAA